MSQSAQRFNKTHRKGRSDKHQERELRGIVQEVENIKTSNDNYNLSWFKPVGRWLSLRNRHSVVEGWLANPRLKRDGRLPAGNHNSLIFFNKLCVSLWTFKIRVDIVANDEGCFIPVVFPFARINRKRSGLALFVLLVARI